MPVGLTEISLVSWQAILGMGCLFVVLGGVFTLLHRRERNNYYNGILLRKRDIKEAITHEPERSWLSAWQVGARICFVIGGALVVAGAVLRLIDFPG